MALSFPLLLDEFFELLPIASLSFAPEEALEMDETDGGEIITADLGSDLWHGSVTMDNLTPAEAGAIVPLLNLLRRPGTSFLMADALRLYPRLDPGGAILGNADVRVDAVAAGRREMAFKGLPAGYALSRGDLVSVAYGTPDRLTLHELVGSVDAVVLPLPPVPPGVAADAVAHFARPSCKAVLVPGGTDLGTVSETITDRVSFRWRQTRRHL